MVEERVAPGDNLDGYLARWAEQLLLPAHEVVASEFTEVAKAARGIADRIKAGGRWLTFGAGHSWSIAAEACSRAGGIPGVVAMHLEDVTGPKVMQWETLADSLPEREVVNGTKLAEFYSLSAKDALLIVSNSARNGACVELAQTAQRVGCFLVVITSKRHSAAVASRHPSGAKVTDFADVVLDNHGVEGDAIIELKEGIVVGGTSTIAGALLAQLVSTAVSQLLLGSGFSALRSANLDPVDQSS